MPEPKSIGEALRAMSTSFGDCHTSFGEMEAAVAAFIEKTRMHTAPSQDEVDAAIASIRETAQAKE